MRYSTAGLGLGLSQVQANEAYNADWPRGGGYWEPNFQAVGTAAAPGGEDADENDCCQ